MLITIYMILKMACGS